MLRWMMLLLLCCSRAWAFAPPAFVPNVVDTAGVLSAAEINELNTTIARLHQESRIQAAVLVISTTNDLTIEQAAVATFDAWRLGQAGHDNGLLIVAAIADRKVRIETGYGLEGAIPDLLARRIIDESIVPQFRESRFAAGLQAALARANAIVLHGEPLEAQDASQSDGQLSVEELTTGHIVAGAIWFVLIAIVPIVVRVLAIRRARMFETHLQPTPQEQAWWRMITPSGTALFLTVFLLINPGIFFVLLSTSGYALVTPFLLAFAYAFIAATNSGYLAMLRPKSRERFLTAPAGRSSSAGRRQAFQSGSGSGSRSSGSSRSSGFSSSSGGGRSGGGGASGSW